MLGDLLWVWFPYASFAAFVGGHIWRYRQDRFAWTDAWMQLFKPRALRWGIVLFHIGAFVVIAGHFLGILVPTWVTYKLGVSDEAYHFMSLSIGMLFGLLAVAGIGAFLWRRTRIAVVVANTKPIDLITLGLLSLVILLGMIDTAGINGVGNGYDYRSTVAVWFRSLLLMSPRPHAIESAPLLYQAHAFAAWLILIVWPYSRLVHVWYFPFWARRGLLNRLRRRSLPL